jgi:hypothetical protein
MNRKGYIIKEAVSSTVFVIFIVVLTLVGNAIYRANIKHDEQIKIPKPTQVLEDVINDSDVTVKVEGYYDGWPYIVFQDKYTFTRILYYRGAMTYLIPKTNRVSKFNVEE